MKYKGRTFTNGRSLANAITRDMNQQVERRVRQAAASSGVRIRKVHKGFEIEGDAKILGVGNGNPATAEIDTATQRMAFNGKAMVIIQAGKTIGKIKLIAKSEGMNDVPLSLNLIQ